MAARANPERNCGPSATAKRKIEAAYVHLLAISCSSGMEEVWREKNRMTDLAGLSVLNGNASDRRGCTSCGIRKSVIVQRIAAGSSSDAAGPENTEGRFKTTAI